MEKGNSEEARVLAGPAACRRYSGPKPPSPKKKKRKKKNYRKLLDGKERKELGQDFIRLFLNRKQYCPVSRGGEFKGLEKIHPAEMRALCSFPRFNNRDATLCFSYYLHRMAEN